VANEAFSPEKFMALVREEEAANQARVSRYQPFVYLFMGIAFLTVIGGFIYACSSSFQNLTLDQKAHYVSYGALVGITSIMLMVYCFCRMCGRSLLASLVIVVGYLAFCAVAASNAVAERLVPFLFTPLGWATVLGLIVLDRLLNRS
jgi:uncharacterized protein involved in response to NO